jgi:O-antigen ligase
LSLRPYDPLERGIFVKNYIDQSQEFTLCAVALAYPVMKLLRDKRYWLAGFLTALALSFLVNMAFVVVSRTALVTVPIMLAVFALLHLRWRSIAIISAALIAGAALAWQASPQLRKTAGTFASDYSGYIERGEATSAGLRLEFWRKSLGFFAEAPVKGHGTGSTRGLFERVKTGNGDQASAEVIGNPHNQTLNVAVQWGIVGIVVLYAIWILHLRLFRGDGLANWIGLLVVVQNIFTSLFNSHLFDFHEGWMYVIGVGVAGGMVVRERKAAPKAGEAGS